MKWFECVLKFYPYCIAYCIALHEKDTHLAMTCEISIQEHKLSVFLLFTYYDVDNSIVNYKTFVYNLET